MVLVAAFAVAGCGETTRPLPRLEGGAAVTVAKPGFDFVLAFGVRGDKAGTGKLIRVGCKPTVLEDSGKRDGGERLVDVVLRPEDFVLPEKDEVGLELIPARLPRNVLEIRNGTK